MTVAIPKEDLISVLDKGQVRFHTDDDLFNFLG
jgi:hypothetical protein